MCEYKAVFRTNWRQHTVSSYMAVCMENSELRYCWSVPWK